MKRFLGHLVLISIFSFLGGLLYSLAQMTPQFKAMAIQKIRKEIKENTPVEVDIKSLEIKLFPPTAKLEGITIKPKDEIKDIIKTLEIPSIEAKVDPLQVLTGKVVISTVNVTAPKIVVNIKSLLDLPSSSPDIDLKPLFDVLRKIPVARLFVSQASVEVQDIKGYNLNAENFEIMVFNLHRSLELWTGAPEINIHSSHVSQTLPFSLRGQVTLDPKNATLSSLTLAQGPHELTLKGDLTNIPKLATAPTGHVSASAKIDLKEFKTLSDFLELKSWPDIQGQVQVQSDIDAARFDEASAKFKISGDRLQYEKMKLGSLQVQGSGNRSQIQFTDVNMVHPAGKAKATDSVLTFDENISFATVLQVPNVDAKALFQALDLSKVPVLAHLKGEGPCKGQFKPSFRLNCDADISGEDFLVHTPAGKTIVALEDYGAKGVVTLTAKDFSYDAQLRVKGAQGSSSGVVSFEDGFKISYETPKWDFKDVKSLVDLKYEGQVAIKGTTEGNSQTATAEMDLTAQNFWFNDFKLGNVKSHLLFKRGILSFQKSSGVVGSSRYTGKFDLILSKDRLAADMDIPFFEVGDMLEIFSRKTKLPVVITGAGSAKIKAWGPFAFNLLSYDVDSVVFRGSAAGESFDRAQFNVTSRDGEVKINKATLQKGHALINMQGTAHPSGNIDVQIEGNGFKLEESDLVSRLGINVIGNTNFRMSLTGYVLSPMTVLKGSVSEVSLDDQDLPDSHFGLHIEKTFIEGQANIIGNRVRSAFTIPFDDRAPFKFKLETVDWNFTSFLSLLGSSSINREYQSALTCNIDLSSERGGFWKSSGKAKINRIMLRRGALSLLNQNPITADMHNGSIDIENFNLVGDQNSLSLNGRDITQKNLAMQLAGKLNLHLIHIFMPFLEDIGGPITFSLKMNGPQSKPEVMGTASIDDGFTKIKGLVHPFEKVNADMIFSHSKVIINSIKGVIAGGTVTGQGVVEIKGVRQLPTDVKLHFENVNLNVPDHMKTSGRGDLAFSGAWFPFMISGNYIVAEGFVDKEFGDDGQGITSVRQSKFLPKVLQESGFEPVLLDLHVNLEKGVKIKNSQVEGDVKGQMDVKGPPSAPHLFGTLVLSPASKLFLRDKIFDVQNATVKFTDPKENNPEIFITATTRVNNYDINLVIQGTAKDPKPRMTSQPPLSDQDIISLLALGITSERLDKDVESRQQAVQSASQIGTVILSQNPLNKQLQKTLGVDIQFSSKFDETRNTSVLKGTVSRKLSPKVTASVGRAFGDQTTTDAKLIYEFNRNVSAIGSWEGRDVRENSNYVGVENSATSVFGLDLEYKVEFK